MDSRSEHLCGLGTGGGTELCGGESSKNLRLLSWKSSGMASTGRGLFGAARPSAGMSTLTAPR